MALASFAGRRFSLAFLWLLACLCTAFPQSEEIDFNTRYRFPLSAGVEYQSLSPFADYASLYNIFDLSANLRWPIPLLPVLQPTLKGGWMRFESLDLTDPSKWDHNHVYGALGLTYAHRFAKTFEIGAEALFGFSEALFPNLLPELGTTGSPNLLFELGARISLDPSYSLNIDVHPNLKYLLSLGDLKDFNGFILGVGFSASFRFGQDPDAPTAIIRSIDIGHVTVPDLFAAMQSYYAKNPMGSVTLTNSEKSAIRNVEVSFYEARFMEAATPAASIEEIGGGQTVTVPLLASFNQEVFKTMGITPVTGEVIVTYSFQGTPVTQSKSVSFDLHDKTAMTWDDNRKVSAFITPADSALRNYSSFIRQTCKDSVVPAVSEPLQFAMQLFHALGEIGCLYQADPSLPFTSVQGDPMVVDSISLPRSTLKMITGDCDDLTVLYCSLLETVGVSSGFITVPGHIYAAFDTKIAANDFAAVHPDRSMTIIEDGNLWIPVEITLIGKTGFLDAWRKGMEQWKAQEDTPEERTLYQTRSSQELYRPVGLTEADLGLQYGNPEAILKGFEADLDRLADTILGDYVAAAREKGRKQDHNRLGIAYARFERFDRALDSFRDAVEIDPDYLSARINMANLQYLQKDFSTALASYKEALDTLTGRGFGQGEKALIVLLNLSKTYYQMERFDEADEYYSKAKAIDAEKVQEYAYLSGDSEARAAEGRDPAKDILFLDVED